MTDMTKKNRLLGRNAAENGKPRKTRIFAVERAAHQTLDVVLAWLSATPAGLSAEPKSVLTFTAAMRSLRKRRRRFTASF